MRHIQTKQKTLSGILALISAENKQAELKQLRIESTIQSGFGHLGFTTATQVENYIEVETESMTTRRVLLEERLATIEGPYNGAIELIISEIDELDGQFGLIYEAEERRATAREELDAASEELDNLQARKSEIKVLSNNPNLDAQIEHAALKEAELGAARPKKCKKGFLNLGYKKACRNHDRAIARLRFLRNVKAGTALENIKAEIQSQMGVVDDASENLQKARRQKRRLETRLAELQGKQLHQEDLKRTATASTRSAIEELELERIQFQPKIDLAMSISSLESQVSSHLSEAESLEQDQNSLPAEIAALEGSTQAKLKAKEDAITAAAAQAEVASAALGAITIAKTEALETREDLADDLAESNGSILVGEAIDIEEKGTLIKKYGRWNVYKANTDVVFENNICKAETVSTVDEVTMKLQVLEVASANDSYLEPMIIVSVESETADLTAYHNLVMSVKGVKDAEFKADLIPSRSFDNKRVFMVQLDDRKPYLPLIILKGTVIADFTDAGEKESHTFSLKGSQNSITKGSKSLRRSCGKIDIQ